MLAWFSRKIDLYAVLDRWCETGSNYEPGRYGEKGWYVDRYEVALGTSDDDALFDKAVRRLFRYAFYPESFVAVASAFIRDERPPEAGERIIQRVRVIPGILDAVTMNIVTSVWQEPDSKGFMLVTSEQQYETGEWSASIARNPDGEVLLRVAVVSRPSKRLLLPARVFARALQKHAHSLALRTFRNAVHQS